MILLKRAAAWLVSLLRNPARNLNPLSSLFQPGYFFHSIRNSSVAQCKRCRLHLEATISSPPQPAMTPQWQKKLGDRMPAVWDKASWELAGSRNLLVEVAINFAMKRFNASEEWLLWVAATDHSSSKYLFALLNLPLDLFVLFFCLWLPLLFLGMEVRHERQFRFMPST